MRSKPVRMLWCGLIVLLFALAAKRQGDRVNIDMSYIDQSAYMSYAKAMVQTRYEYVGGRNRMPLYPGLMSLFYKEGMSDGEFFELGKNVGIVIGLVGSVVAFLLFSKVSKPMDALVGTLVAMFTVLVYKAPYFQTEVLFYAINLVLFYLLLSLLRTPRLRTAALAGLVGGIGHLTKASVLPALVLAAALLVARGAVGFWRRHQGERALSSGSSPSRVAIEHLVCLAVFVACFLIVVFPYIRTSKERFGQYFYNVNSTFYMWSDSWAEAKQWPASRGADGGSPGTPERQDPSFSRYVQEHSLGDVLRRLVVGSVSLCHVAVRSYGFAEFLLVYLIALVLLFAQNESLRLSALKRRLDPCALLFVAGYFSGYVLLYAWYTPIALGERFMLALFLPAMLIVVWVLSYAQDRDLGFDCFGRRMSAAGVSPAVLLFLIAYLVTVFPHRLATRFGGG